MSRQLSIPTHFKLVTMLYPRTTNAALTTQVISLRGCSKATVVFLLNNAVGFSSTPTLIQATDIAAATNKAGPVSAIWSNLDTSSTDTLVARTAAASYAEGTGATPSMIVFEVDASTLDVNNGYDCIYFTMGTSSQATDFVAAIAILHTSYQQATPPSQILD
ncbi:MAG: hypothetical protein V4491_02555 [Pseudomonadota bacterium]